MDDRLAYRRAAHRRHSPSAEDGSFFHAPSIYDLLPLPLSPQCLLRVHYARRRPFKRLATFSTFAA